MTINKSDYETLLSEYSNQLSAIALLKQYRPYLEMIPSMRRPNESVITIPLPVIRIRHAPAKNHHQAIIANREAVFLSCDLAILMCDPEWKIKMGGEICIFIHRPEEDFSDLLLRWRQTQVFLDQDYEWILPHRYQHIIADPAENVYPLFVLFNDTPERIKRGLLGAALPFVVQNIQREEQKDTDSEDHSLMAND